MHFLHEPTSPLTHLQVSTKLEVVHFLDLPNTFSLIPHKTLYFQLSTFFMSQKTSQNSSKHIFRISISSRGTKETLKTPSNWNIFGKIQWAATPKWTAALPGKLKLWCFQFGLPPWLMWPLTTYKVSLSHAICLQKLVNSWVSKWLGLLRYPSSVILHINGTLSLPVSSLVEEQARTTEKKWSWDSQTAQRRYINIQRRPYSTEGALGLGTKTSIWQKASTAEYWTMSLPC